MNQTPVFAMRMMKEKLRYLELTEMPKRARKGLEAAGRELLKDAVEVEPKAPVDTTSLIGSGSVFVEGDKVHDSAYGVPGTVSRYDPKVTYTDYRAGEGEPTFKPGVFEAAVVFNAPYAAEQHESWPHKHEPGAGMHFISAKIGAFMEKYIDTIYDALNLGH